ncbi:uncharacterized protein EV420DRAFT_1580416 [Desarmillaria tabescens]|uniref:Uncharacterized protein n=1 Tax=Armillaria tabescens TaxID=1929756 RepID=A0AA39JEE0_ARMTA|nr:uncharacterized protein EV420DRAFT_1580416 [Desarmillaria tabescens]KAK0441231.1 hypothetical protein EV420DRAFT_1580416 [Desarmillaria tabescens]
MGQYWNIINIDRREHLGHWATESLRIIILLADTWKGCRIICAGDYMTDSPPNVLTSEELAEIESLPEDIETGRGRTLYTLATEHYKHRTHWNRSFDLGGTVLRNRTKRVYVRRDAVVEELAEYGGDIGSVLLANISWSNDSSCAMRVDLSRGAWAGDRLDVVPLWAVENNEEWEDVTEDQVKLTRFAISCNR